MTDNCIRTHLGNKILLVYVVVVCFELKKKKNNSSRKTINPKLTMDIDTFITSCVQPQYKKETVATIGILM